MKIRLGILFCGFALTQFTIGQDIPPEATGPEEPELLALAVKLTRPSLAFKAEAIQQMLPEVNYYVERLNLPVQRPVTLENASIWVTPPWFSKRASTNASLSKVEQIRAATFFVTGVVKSHSFSFAFNNSGKLGCVHRLRIKDENSILDLYPELARTPSLIDSNGAYQLATQWLSAVSVDVPALERKCKPGVFQWFFWGKPEDLPKDQWTYREPTSTNKTMLPVFDVNWGEGTPSVKVTILGTTKELIEMWMQDSSFSSRPTLHITNAIELNTRPDPPAKQLMQNTTWEGPTNTAPARIILPPRVPTSSVPFQ